MSIFPAKFAGAEVINRHSEVDRLVRSDSMSGVGGGMHIQNMISDPEKHYVRELISRFTKSNTYLASTSIDVDGDNDLDILITDGQSRGYKMISRWAVYINSGDNYYKYLTARIDFNPNCFYIGNIKALQTWGIVNCNAHKYWLADTMILASFIDWENSIIVGSVILVPPEKPDEEYFVKGMFSELGEINDFRIEFLSNKALKEKYPKILGSNKQEDATKE